MIKKIRNSKLKIRNCNAGMTYIELIVVLSIFSVLSSVVVFNYGGFQDKVDLKNLASDIALQIVQAQKSALSGALPLSGYDSTWKPSYGVYFNSSTGPDALNPISNTTPFNKEFIYFANTENNGYNPGVNRENPVWITITKSNTIDKIVCVGYCSSIPNPISSLSIIFTRPDSKADFYSNNSKLTVSGSDYVQITIKSLKGLTTPIKIYPSGRVQVN